MLCYVKPNRLAKLSFIDTHLWTLLHLNDTLFNYGDNFQVHNISMLRRKS